MDAFGTDSGGVLTAFGGVADTRERGDLAHPTASPAGSGRRRLRGHPEARLGQVGGVGESGGFPCHDPDAGARLPAGGQLLDPAVVELGRRVAPLLGEHLGEVAPCAQGDAEHPLDHRLVDHRTFLSPAGHDLAAALDAAKATRLP